MIRQRSVIVACAHGTRRRAVDVRCGSTGRGFASTGNFLDIRSVKVATLTNNNVTRLCPLIRPKILFVSWFAAARS